MHVKLKTKSYWHGFRFYETLRHTAGFVAHRIYMGDRETVDLGINQSTPITIPRGQAANLEANFELDDKLEAPLAKVRLLENFIYNWRWRWLAIPSYL